MCKFCNPKYWGPSEAQQRADIGWAEEKAGKHDDEFTITAKRAPGKKDTKRWCKGKEGREHNWAPRKANWAINRECQMYSGWDWRTETTRSWWKCYHEMACTNCGKQKGYNWEVGIVNCPDRNKYNVTLYKKVE